MAVLPAELLSKQQKDEYNDCRFFETDKEFEFNAYLNTLEADIFLKMTGLLEQKFRAMVWVMANNSRDYRRTFLRERSFGEYSNLSDKKTVYKDLIEQIFVYRKDPFEINHKQIAKAVVDFIVSIFKETIFDSNLHGELLAFCDSMSKQSFCIQKITTEKVSAIF